MFGFKLTMSHSLKNKNIPTPAPLLQGPRFSILMRIRYEARTSAYLEERRERRKFQGVRDIGGVLMRAVELGIIQLK